MKLSDLLNEVNVFKNNFVRADMAVEAVEKLFPEETPKIQYDEKGMFIILNNFQFRDYENTGMGSFSLTDGGIQDEIKNTKKYYVEYVKVEATVDTTDQTDEDKVEGAE